MELPLFRKEVIEAPSRNGLGTVRLAAPISQQAWALAAVCAGTAIVIWLFAGHYTRRAHVTGLLVPQSGLISISANSAGVVDQISIAEGDHVKAGDALLSISGEHISKSLGNTSANVSEQLQREMTSLQQDIRDTQALEVQQVGDNRTQQRMLQGQLDQLNAQLAIETKQMALAQELVTKWKPLLARGYVSMLQVEQEEASVLSDEGQYKALLQQRYSTQQQLSALNDQLTQLPLTTSAKLDDLRRQSAQIEQTLAQNEATRDSVVHAPRSGTISSLLAKPGTTVTVGQPLLAVVPAGASLQAQVLVPSQAIGFVHPGTEVALHYQSFPYEKFGLQKGAVLTISRSALLPNEVTLLLGGGQPPSNDPLYLVRVKLTSQSVQAYGRDEPLKPGMALDADLLLDRRRIIEWIFEPLLGMGRQWSKTS